jgi:hypothetical protein
MSASETILRRIRAKRRGWVFTPKDFIDIAPRSTIDVTLHRLVAKEIIRKVSQGIYDFPVIHPKLGVLTPNPEALAKAVAKKKGDTIHPSAAAAANQLGIDTQVPAKPSYVTSLTSIDKNIANYPISLRRSKYTSSEKLNPNVANAINALLHLGKNNITPSILKQVKSTLTKRDKLQLRRNLAKFPDWLVPFILDLIRN